MIKVLHLSSGNLYGGVETLIATLARERGCAPQLEMHVALCFEGRLKDELTALGLDVTLLGEVQTRYPWQILRARRRLAALLRATHFDVVICHMPWVLAMFGPVVERLNLPLVFWMHDAVAGAHWVERWAGRCRPNLVLCNSRFTAQTLPVLFRRSVLPRHELIHYPVSNAAEHLTPPERAAVRAGENTPPDAVVIIQVGRMEPYKGHMLHLEALARLADTPGWVCWLVGGPQRPHEAKYFEELRARAAASGIGDRVRLLGDRRDVRRLLAAADVFCQPNLRGEPFGIVFIEALQAGLPVVATAIGGALEIVTAECGRLAPPGDPEALAALLLDLLTDASLRHHLGRNGLARALELSDPVRLLDRLQKLLAGLSGL